MSFDTNLVYLLTDLRKKLPRYCPISMVGHDVNGIILEFADGYGRTVMFPAEDDEGMLEEPEDGRLIIHLPEGDVVLEPLTIDNYQKWAAPYFDEAPTFDKITDLQAYWRHRVKSA